jgi:phosphoribosylformylglycinamidine synthase subunit PurQ / glutaminase
MKFGVVIFPGSNCDEDIIYVLRDLLNKPVEKLWHKDTDLKKCDFIILPGGFSYGDYLRSGAIARFSPIMTEVVKFSQKGGYVLGICNGFQILCEAGMLPGALLHNSSQKFICKNVFIKANTKNSMLTRSVDLKKPLKIPIAHGEGRFYANDKTMDMIKNNDQILFKYCDQLGNVSIESNPNGTLENIAGITNKERNIFGLMPHPERASDEILGNTDGRILFESILNLVSF